MEHFIVIFWLLKSPSTSVVGDNAATLFYDVAPENFLWTMKLHPMSDL